MPKQLFVYMTRDDEDKFLDFLKTKGNFVLLPGRAITPDFPRVETLPEASQAESTRRFLLQNTATTLPLSPVVTQEGDYVIDGFQSPVIEFVRSIIVARMMLPGRLQADMNYLDGDKQDLVPKPVEFRKWYDLIDGWIRKNYSHVSLLTYAGPGAEMFREQGGVLH